MTYKFLKTLGVYAINCKVEGRSLRIGLLVLTKPMGIVQLLTSDNDRLKVDLSGVAEGTSYSVYLPTAIIL
jgi:hypothetical protein